MLPISLYLHYRFVLEFCQVFMKFNNNLLINFGVQSGNNNVKTQFPCAYTGFVIVVGATFNEGYVGFNPINLTTFNKGASNGWPCQWLSIGY